jgi:predicted branched-subunit amino acid permease
MLAEHEKSRELLGKLNEACGKLLGGDRSALPAVAAWALVTGVAMAQSGLPVPVSVGLSLIAYAGSAQLATLPLLVAGAPLLVTVLTALMVNLRFVIYSAAVAPSLRTLPLGKRLAVGYVLGDISFVVYMRHESRWPGPEARAWYFLGVGLAMFAVWHVGSLVGLLGATAIPREWGLDFVGILALVALWVPALASRPTLAGSAVAAALSVALDRLPFRSGLVVAILAGIAVALAADRRREVAG